MSRTVEAARNAVNGVVFVAATPHEIAGIFQSMPRNATRDDSHLTMRVRAMRRFFGTASSVGLDTSADSAMRAALGEFFERGITSRTQLSAADWVVARAGIESGVLTW